MYLITKNDIILLERHDYMENELLIKLDNMIPYSIDKLKEVLTEEEKELFGNLYSKGLFYLKWNDDYQELQFTNYGLLEVFKLKYQKELNNFIEYLTINNYKVDDHLINNFLLSTDLTLPSYEVLTVTNFNNFCEITYRPLL